MSLGSNWLTPVRLQQMDAGNLLSLEQFYYVPNFLSEMQASFGSSNFDIQYYIIITEYIENYDTTETEGRVFFREFLNDLMNELQTGSASNRLQRVVNRIDNYTSGEGDYLEYAEYVLSQLPPPPEPDEESGEVTIAGPVGINAQTGLTLGVVESALAEDRVEGRDYQYTQPNFVVDTTASSTSPTGMIFIDTEETNTFNVTIPYVFLDISPVDVESNYKIKFREF